MQRYAENEGREVDEIFRIFALLSAQKFSFMVFCQFFRKYGNVGPADCSILASA